MRILSALVALLLSTSALAADPKPAKASKKPAAKADSPAIQDAKKALLGPCTPEQANGKVVAVEVIDGGKMNAAIEQEKLPHQKAVPAAHFLAVTYESGGKQAKDYRQVTTSHGLTTEQAQALVGQRLCVFGRAP
jgi:hypothetical protein